MLTEGHLQMHHLMRRLLLLNVSFIFGISFCKVADDIAVGAFKGSIFVTRNARAYLERKNFRMRLRA